MRRSVVVVLVALGGVTVTAPAKAKKEAPLSRMFCQARYVYVETYEGAINPDIARQYPADYDAAVGVQQRIERWDRYKLAYEEQQADLVFVVWKARPEGNRLPGQPTQMRPVTMPQIPGTGTGPSPGQNPRNPQGTPGQTPGDTGGPDGAGISRGGPGVAVYPPNDQLAVYQPQGDGSLAAPLWKKTEKDGLKEPRMTLFGQLADAVDDACSNATGSSH
jgi:hypothetical protein